MKKIAIILALIACSAHADRGRPDVTYVGNGRYSCSGSASDCASYNANNRALDRMEAANARAEREIAEQRYIYDEYIRNSLENKQRQDREDERIRFRYLYNLGE